MTSSYSNPNSSRDFVTLNINDVLRSNIVISAPTGSGKTTAVISLIPQLTRYFNKVIVLVPTRALANEVFERIRRIFNDVSIDTSDARLEKNYNFFKCWSSKVIVTTYERFDSIQMSLPLPDKKLIIIDEVHSYKDPERAIPIISTLISAKEKNDRVICLSATIPQLENLVQWLNARLIRKDDRVTELKVETISIGTRPRGRGASFRYFSAVLEKVKEIIKRILREDKNPQIIIFRANKKQLYQMKEVLEREFPQLRIAVHHASLPPAERKRVEAEFRARRINIILATHTLAYGVNLPAKYVIIAGLSNYLPDRVVELSDVDVVQMIGRAGRPEFDVVGYAYIIYAEEERPIVDRALNKEYTVNDITSELPAFVLRLIYTGRIRNLDDLAKWSEALPSFFNVTAYTFERAYRELEELGLVKEFKCTELGEVLAKNYVTTKMMVAVTMMFKLLPTTVREDPVQTVLTTYHLMRLVGTRTTLVANGDKFTTEVLEAMHWCSRNLRTLYIDVAYTPFERYVKANVDYYGMEINPDDVSDVVACLLYPSKFNVDNVAECLRKIAQIWEEIAVVVIKDKELAKKYRALKHVFRVVRKYRVDKMFEVLIIKLDDFTKVLETTRNEDIALAQVYGVKLGLQQARHVNGFRRNNRGMRYLR